MNRLFKKIMFLIACTLFSLGVQAQETDWKVLTHYDKKAVKTQLTERLTKYVTFNTQANENATKVPSSSGQKKLAKTLAKELKKYGAENVKIDAHSIVTAEIPANVTNNAPVIAFFAHMDTATDTSGANVKPQIHTNYRGGDIVINAEKNLVLNSLNSPQLNRAKGHDIVTASGGTLLGADDKNGLAIIMTFVQFLYDHPQVKHGTIKIAFTPDEEIGEGIGKFNVDSFGADYAYTVDGGDKGEIINETFNARSFTAVFKGNRGFHPGSAMNSPFSDNLLMASDFHTLLPRHQRPETTSGKRGFILVDSIITEGNTSTVKGILRAFSDEETQTLTDTVTRAFQTVKGINPKGTGFSLNWKEEYNNMYKALPEKSYQMAQAAMEAEGIAPKLVAARGGTDGAGLSVMGLPTPDIFAGMYNIHGEMEYADIDVMEDSFRTLMRLSSLWLEQEKESQSLQ